MVMEQDEDDFGVDLASYENKQQEEEIDAVDLEEYADKAKDEPSWTEKVTDIFVQAGRGALGVFTWPADVLKLGIIGEGLSDIDDLERVFEREGKPFDRERYIQGVYDAASFVPTQEAAEKGFESLTGTSLQPKTEAGKIAKQFAGLAGFTPGGAAKKLASATVGVGATQALKSAGFGEESSELAGDVASLSPSVLAKVPRKLGPAATKLKNTAQKYTLPFLEFMAREKAPVLKGKLGQAAEQQLKSAFDLSIDQAINKVVEDKLPFITLRNRGVNLEALTDHAYNQTRRLAQAHPNPISTAPIVQNIEAEIQRIKNLAPSSSDAQKAAISVLEAERDILKVSTPTPEQLINQHINYNSNVRSIYAKPEFAGKENEVRKAYGFLNNELVTAMKDQGNQTVAASFAAANKIFSESSKIRQTEDILKKAFTGESYDPKKVERILTSRNGKFLQRNLGKSGVKELEDIAKYGKEAQEKMGKFIELHSPAVGAAVRNWGELAPLIFLPHNLKGASVVLAGPVAKRVQGKLLTRPALREAYKFTLQHAAEGSFQLLRKDFARLEELVGEEWGDVQGLIDDSLSDLEFDEEEEELSHQKEPRK